MPFKKAKRTRRNWLLFALVSYVIVSVVLGLGLALSPNVAAGRWLAFVYSFVAPFEILIKVFERPGDGRMWMGLGAVSFLFISCLWVLSQYLMESPRDEEEAARLRRLEELRPKVSDTASSTDD
jgi:apolipoprotein N-acyltransferase